jgi:hypothetical protein
MLSLFVRLVRRLRRFRSAEFLEALIVPKRIEHRIESEQCRSEEVVRKVFALLFRRQGRDDFLKPRIAAERVPEGQQLELFGYFCCYRGMGRAMSSRLASLPLLGTNHFLD